MAPCLPACSRLQSWSAFRETHRAGARTLADRLADPNARTEGELIEGFDARERAAEIRRVLAETLTARECAILEARLGLGATDGEGRTLQEIGRALGISRQAVYQAEAAALRKLRDPAARRRFARAG